MTTFLLLYTEPPTRRVFETYRPGRLVFASDEITPEDRAVYDECVQLPPLRRVDLAALALSRFPADRVVAQTEYGLLPGAMLGACPADAALLCSNKWLQRTALAAAGVRVPRFALASTAEDVRREADRYPIVLKPVVSTLGHGVIRVDSAARVPEAVDGLRAHLLDDDLTSRCAAFAEHARLDMGCDPSRQFLVEEYVDGAPLETDGLVFGDRIDCFGTTEQVVDERFRIEAYMFPADGADLRRVTESALRACKVREMGFSIEFRGDTVIEVNGRLGEDDGFPDLFHAALGAYPIRKWIERDGRPLAPKQRAAVAFRNEPGRVHAAWALATHPASSRAAYEAARAKL